MVKLNFLHNQWSDVNHIWRLWSLDDCLPSLCVWWPVAILFGCHGNINFLKKKEFFKWQLLQNHWNSRTFCTNVAWLKANPSSKKFAGLPLGLVAMATESSHRIIMGKWLNCTFSITSEMIWAIFGIYDHLMIVYLVYMFYDRWPLCLVATAVLNFEKGLFQMTTSKPLTQYNSNLVQKLHR